MARKPQPPRTLDSLVATVRERYPDMSPQFQIGARHLIDFPERVPVESMRRIAAQAGVQPATLVRLAQSLGYTGWEPLRQIFVRGLAQAPRRYADQARATVGRRDPRSMLSRHADAQSANLQLLDDLNGELLADTARLLAKAPHVHIAGFRASHAAAYSLHYLYRLFRNSVSLIRGDAGLLEMELRALQPDDAVVIIGFAPYSQETMRVAEAAHNRGCRSIALCDSKVAPIARHADPVLIFSTDTAHFFPSSVAALALVEALGQQLLQRSGRRAIEALDQTEDQLRQTGAYLGQPPPA